MNRHSLAEIIVGMGDCQIAGAEGAGAASVLSTYALGPCIAVIVYDWKNKIGGMLHVMLPDSSIDRARAAKNPFVYVDTGVPELFRRMKEAGCSQKLMRCSIAGGARMIADSTHFEIGRRNYLALRKSLQRLGVVVDREDVGGSESRSVRLDLESGRVDLRRGAGEGKILAPAAIELPKLNTINSRSGDKTRQTRLQGPHPRR